MNKNYTAKERLHLEKVKSLSCSVCDHPAPSEAHHIKQSSAWTAIALCTSCHRNPHNGLHGRKAMWNIHKMDELDALAVTIRRLNGN